MDMAPIIQSIKERRLQLKVTQAQLADMAGVSRRFITLVESGQGNPRLETLEKMANVLGLEVIVSTQIKKV
jgi:predicted transcriptional regulator